MGSLFSNKVYIKRNTTYIFNFFSLWMYYSRMHCANNSIYKKNDDSEEVHINFEHHKACNKNDQSKYALIIRFRQNTWIDYQMCATIYF